MTGKTRQRTRCISRVKSRKRVICLTKLLVDSSVYDRGDAAGGLDLIEKLVVVLVDPLVLGFNSFARGTGQDIRRPQISAIEWPCTSGPVSFYAIFQKTYDSMHPTSDNPLVASAQILRVVTPCRKFDQFIREIIILRMKSSVHGLPCRKRRITRQCNA